jgi:hypothetical protein
MSEKQFSSTGVMFPVRRLAAYPARFQPPSQKNRETSQRLCFLVCDSTRKHLKDLRRIVLDFSGHHGLTGTQKFAPDSGINRSEENDCEANHVYDNGTGLFIASELWSSLRAGKRAD